MMSSSSFYFVFPSLFYLFTFFTFQTRLIPYFTYTLLQVRDTTAWTIGKVCVYHKAAITKEMLQPMLEGTTTPHI